MRILVVEDYAPMRLAICGALQRDGHAVDAAGDGPTGLAMAGSGDHALIILDLQLPGLDGLELLRRLRSAGAAVHVLIVTARDQEAQRIAGLDAGADDYLVKPFSLGELQARVRALGRRAWQRKDPLVRVADLALDTTTRRVSRAGDILDLTAREYAILETLMVRAGTVVARELLWEGVWSESDAATSNVLEVHISSLRRKLEAGGRPRLIHTRRGEGYLLAEES